MMPTWTLRLAGVAACLFAVAGGLAAQEPKVTPLMTKGLPEVPGKEVLMITVEYAPCWSDPVHRHNAHGWIPASLHQRFIPK